MSKREVGKRLPESVPSALCAMNQDGVHLQDPTSSEWCISCDEWIGDGSDPEPESCYKCGEHHSPDDCDSPYNCDICDMDGPMDGDQFDYTELDHGIRASVKFLRDHGFWTTDSGDGVSKMGTDMEDCALSFPHVFIVVEPRNMVDESRKLAAVLAGHGVQVQQQGMKHLDKEYLAGFSDDERPTWDTTEAVEIEASYDPMTDIAVLMVSYISDSLLARHGITFEERRDSN